MAQATEKSNGHLTDETVEILCKAAIEKNEQLGLEISLSVCDADGLPRLFRRFGDALAQHYPCSSQGLYFGSNTDADRRSYATCSGWR